MLWNFDFLPTSCTSGQHSFFKRPTWVRRVFSPKETCNFPPSFRLVFARLPPSAPEPWAFVCESGVELDRGARSLYLDEAKLEGDSPWPRHRCFFSPRAGTQKAPGVSPRNVRRSADPGQVLDAFCLPMTKLLPAERGPA